jgi:hypothetical protein
MFFVIVIRLISHLRIIRGRRDAKYIAARFDFGLVFALFEFAELMEWRIGGR